MHRRSILALPIACLPPALKAAGEPPVLEVRGSRILLQPDESFDADLLAALRDWVRRAAEAVAAFLGRFPQPEVELLLTAVGGAGVRGGTAYPEPEPYLRVRIGRATRAAQLADDWVLTHEMMHLAIPNLRRRHLWLHEGLATYAGELARVQAGLLSPAAFWASLVRGMPNGLPAEGDLGLDNTPTWGRTYWGGALFCLLADVRLRRREPQQGLREALRGVLAAGGHYGVAWPIERLLSTADAAVGGDALRSLYESMKDASYPVDLPALWHALGTENPQQLDPDAALATVRDAITGGTPQPVTR